MAAETGGRRAKRKHRVEPTHITAWEEIGRAFREFLTLPSLVIAAFLLLALGTHLLDQSQPDWMMPLRRLLLRHLFKNAGQTGALLGTVASSVITVTSITFSLLLLAVQQGATAMTQQVVDQFLRRRNNQFYFGFFVGLGIYALLILATANPPYNPVLGGLGALVLTAAALYLLLLLIYTTLDQMRPPVIVRAIHDRTLTARCRQTALLTDTRRTARRTEAPVSVRSEHSGFLVHINLDTLKKALAGTPEVEIEMQVAIGAFVAYGDVLADVRAARKADAEAVSRSVAAAVFLERQRDLDDDPAYGIRQLLTIGWTAVSTAKSNPAPGLLVIQSLRDLLARWVCVWEEAAEREEESGDGTRLPVVYHDDVPAELMSAFEALIVVSSESMQFQSCAAVLSALARNFNRLSPDARRRVEDITRRALSCLGEQVLTAELEAALEALAGALEAGGGSETAALVSTAKTRLSRSLGRLGSRATRADPGQ